MYYSWSVDKLRDNNNNVSDGSYNDDDDHCLSDLNYFQIYQRKSVQCLKSIWLM